MKSSAWSFVNLLAAILFAWLVTHQVDAERQVQLGLGLFVCIGWLWISEAIHISVTALLVPLLASMLGIFSVGEAFSNFANPVIFLFMGGFALAAALQKFHIDRIFAFKLIRISQGNPTLSILLLFLATSLLSMWISNTATVAMMLPLALGLLASEDPQRNPKLYLFVLLGLAYAGNVGGVVTLIGSPANAIAASVTGMSFGDWLGYGVPAFLILFPLMPLVLYATIKPNLSQGLHLEEVSVEPDQRRTAVLVIFGITAGGWMFSGALSGLLGVADGFDAIVAVFAIVVLTASRLLTFEEFVSKTRWEILILFGGGLTLSAALQQSGASAWLADNIILMLPLDQPWVVMLMICVFVIFLTELVSNTASAALLVPLFYSVAPELGLSSDTLVVMIAVCASCAFMLPVATPPNALVFSSGHIPQRQMMRAGLLMNLVFAFVLSIVFLWY